MRLDAAILSLILAAAPAAAQEHDHAERAEAGREDPASQPKPDGWMLRLDRPDRGSADDVLFTDMAPGWHVTTGPAVVLYHPDSTATGEYRVDADVFLFDPGERREGFGVFFGGRELQGDAQQYVYFLLRRDGRYLVKTRNGSETAVVRDWTEHDAVVGWDEREADAATVRNRLSVVVGADDVSFLVNDTEVTRIPRADLPPIDGIFGLRVNHGLNLHVGGVSSSAAGSQP